MTFPAIENAMRPLDAANRLAARSRHASIALRSYASIKRVLMGTALLLLPATQALAGDVPPLWISNANGSWFDDANWVDGIAPEAGVNARFGDGTFEDPPDVVDVDNNGNGVLQPGDTLFVNDKVLFLDASAGGDAPLADDGMVFDTIIANGVGGEPVTFDVPITATTVESSRHGAVFNREIRVTELLAVSSHQDQWSINGGVMGSIALVLLDEQRGPDGDTIDGSLALNSTLRIDLLEHVWGELRVGSGAVATVGTYVYSDYTGNGEFSNTNSIRIDGTLIADQFTVFSVASGLSSDLPLGIHGRIGHPTAEFKQAFISGDGLLIFDPDLLFQDGFE